MALITSQNRLIECVEKAERYIGMNIFKSREYSYSNNVVELKYVDKEKSRVLKHKASGIFGRVYYSIELEGITRFSIYLESESDADTFFRLLCQHLDQYDKKKEKEAAAAPAAVGTSSAKISEIRKLYEDGLITKEEMLDLIKSIV